MKRHPASLLARLTLLGLLALAGPLHAAEPTWITDLARARERAAAEKKHVLINFTGSDWCGFCIKLHREVFSKPEFAGYARQHLVLVELDFPRRKEQPEELKAANRKWRDHYKVTAFPTLVVLDPRGQEVGKMVGYGGGGLTAVLEKLGLPAPRESKAQ